MRARALVVALAFSAGSQRTPALQAQTRAERFQPLSVLARARDDGPAARDTTVALSVSLPVAKPAELQAYVDAAGNPASPLYRRFLSPEEVGARFGLPEERVAALANHLSAHGLSIARVAKNRLSILAQGTVAQAESAFGTRIRKYRLDARAEYEPDRFVAQATPIVLPPDLEPLVVNVGGLETYTRPRRAATTLSPAQGRSLYDTQGLFQRLGLTGTTRTIGIASFDGFRAADWESFIAAYALPTPAAGPGTNITVVPCNGGGAGAGFAAFEGDLDIQMELGAAPLASIRVYDSPANVDLVSVLTEIANENACDVVSTSFSWNLTPSQAIAAHNLHLAMTAQGITFMAASGDRGTTLEPFAYPNYEPEVLSIGGTMALVDDTTGNRVIEQAWSGSGGGWSTQTLAFNVRPSWQRGNGVPPVTPATDHRLTPDLAFHSRGNGSGPYFFYSHGALQSGIYGTSFASPQFAGSLALLEEYAILLGGLSPDATGNRRLGRIQDFLYGLDGRPDLFYDLTFGYSGQLPDGSASDAGPGWDTVTGWGPVDCAALAPLVACATGASCGTGTPFCFGDGSLFASPCPCANFGAPGRGCENSRSTGGARLEASGSTSPDTLILAASGEPPTSFSVLFQASLLLYRPSAYGDGVLCMGRRLVALYRKKAAGGAIVVPGPNDPSVSARSAALGVPVVPGASRHYQIWYRDPAASFCGGSAKSSVNLSNAVTIPW